MTGTLTIGTPKPPASAPANAGAPDSATKTSPAEGDADFDYKAAYESLKAKGTPATDPKLQENSADDAKALATKAGLDVGALEKEYADNGGKLSAESLKKLKDAGVTEDKLKAYVEAQTVINNAKATDYENAIYAEFEGGKEDFEHLKRWAEASLNAEEVAEINRELLSGDKGRARRVLREVVESYEASQGVEPTFVSGAQGSVKNGEKPYGSREEVLKDMQSKKYHKDPAFRAKVQARLIASGDIGI